MAVVSLPHIEIDGKGVARIAGSRIKVRLLMEEHIFWKCTPEQIQQHHPQLTLNQVLDAFAYYFANREAMDAEIERVRLYVEEMRAKAGPSPFAERMRREGFLK